MLTLYDSHTSAACHNAAPMHRDNSYGDLRILDATRRAERLLCCEYGMA